MELKTLSNKKFNILNTYAERSEMMDTVAKRIKLRLDELGMRQSDLAKREVANKSTISMWLNGNAIPSNERLVKLAQALETSASWILSGQNENENQTSNTLNNNTINKICYAPLISWSKIRDLKDMKNIDFTENDKKFPLMPGASKDSFYLEVQGISNAPYYQNGEKICIDPQYSLDDIDTGEMVVVIHNGNAMFRAVLRSEDKCYLKALNKEWQPNILEVDDSCLFIGKYVGSFKEPIKHQFT